MTNEKQGLHYVSPAEVEGFDSLAKLALDMRWSWNHPDDELWPRLDQWPDCGKTRDDARAAIGGRG